MSLRRIIALVISVMIILSISPIHILIDVFAGLSPYLPIYGNGTYSTPADYKQIHPKVFEGKGAVAPNAKFSVINNADSSIIDTSADGPAVTRVEKIPQFTTIRINNLSSPGSGTAIDMLDFQVTRDGSQISTIQGLPTNLNGYELNMSTPGIYRFYMCVRDNTDRKKTDYWGNWSYNGAQRAKGLNYGINGAKETTGTPETAGGDDYWGWWYFTVVEIEVVKNPPTADFNIYYKGEDVTGNSGSPRAVDPGNKSLILEDNSNPYSPTEPIVSRKWSYWDVTNGWKEIPGSTNKTTVDIADMDTSLPGSGQNKAFKIECSTSTGGSDCEEHTAYFNKVLASGYIIYYRDQATGRDLYPEKVMSGLGFGSYIEHALPASADSELITPSPQTIVLDSATPFKNFTFYYRMDNPPPPPPPSNDPPSAILNAPDTVMAGTVVRADGGDSWSNNPDGYIADYYFTTEGANLISDNGSYVRVWYPTTGTYTIYLEVEDERGATDWVDHEITVAPPIPTAVMTISGNLKENRKVTLNSIESTSPYYYPLDVTKTTWTITAISGGAATDIKYSGSLTGTTAKDVLFKKAGTYRVRLTVQNTYGRSASAEQTITIVPDLLPVAKHYLPTPEGVPYKVYRDPSDASQATFQLFNESYSPDGDTINKAVALYCYDSDNDVSFADEQWYYSKNGTTWVTTGMDFDTTARSFNIFNIATSNPTEFTLKANQVGKYYFAIRVMEAIQASETIPEFIMESDYRRADTFN